MIYLAVLKNSDCDGLTDGRTDGHRVIAHTAIAALRVNTGWWRGTVAERRSVTGALSLSYDRPAADG